MKPLSISFILLGVILTTSCMQDNTSSEIKLQAKIDSLEQVNNQLNLSPNFRYDYSKTTYKRDVNEMTDAEIRAIRKKDPNHIYKTTGRAPVLSDKQEFEKRAQQYVEDNIDDILDEHR